MHDVVMHDVGMHDMGVHEVAVHEVAVHNVAMHDMGVPGTGVPGMAVPSAEIYKIWAFSVVEIIFDAHFREKNANFSYYMSLNKFCRFKDSLIENIKTTLPTHP